MAQALVGRLGAVVEPACPRARPRLGHELLHGLEEIHVQAGEPVDAGELRIGGVGGEAIIADEVAHDGAIFLLDVGTVILLPGATTGEGDPLASAPGAMGSRTWAWGIGVGLAALVIGTALSFPLSAYNFRAIDGGKPTAATSRPGPRSRNS